MTIELLTRREFEEGLARHLREIKELISPLTQSQPLLKAKEVKAQLNVCHNKLIQLEINGELEPINKTGHRKYRAEDVENYKRGRVK